MKRAIIYARVSDDELQTGQSIADQVTRCKKFVADQGWSLADFGDGGVLSDEGRGRDSEDGRDYRAILRALDVDRRTERPPFDVIVVDRLDRLQVNTEYFGRIRNLAKRTGVILKGRSGTLDTSQAFNSVSSSIEAELADLEKEKIRERARDTAQSAAEKGRNIGGEPYGYLAVGAEEGNPRLEIRPEHADVVRRIFRMFVLDRMNPAAIAFALTDEGVPSPSSRRFEDSPRNRKKWARKPPSKPVGTILPWSDKGVVEILRRRAYIGEREVLTRRNTWLDDAEKEKLKLKRRRQQFAAGDGIVVPVPPILTGPDRKLFERAATRLALSRNGVKKPPGEGRKRRAAGEGILLPTFCTECGGKYINSGTLRTGKKRTGPVETKLACSCYLNCGVGEKWVGKGDERKQVPRERKVRTDVARALTCSNSMRVRESVAVGAFVDEFTDACMKNESHLRKYAAKLDELRREAAERASGPSTDVAALKAALTKARDERDNVLGLVKALGVRAKPALIADYEAAEAKVERLEQAVESAGKPKAAVKVAPADVRLPHLVARLRRLYADLQKHPDLYATARTALRAIVERVDVTPVEMTEKTRRGPRTVMVPRLAFRLRPAALGADPDGLRDEWRPQRDSNPCRYLERVMS